MLKHKSGFGNYETDYLYPEVEEIYEATYKFLRWCISKGGTKANLIDLADNYFQAVEKHLPTTVEDEGAIVRRYVPFKAKGDLIICTDAMTELTVSFTADHYRRVMEEMVIVRPYSEAGE